MSYLRVSTWRATSLRELGVAVVWALGMLLAGVAQQMAVFGELSSDWDGLMQSMNVQFRGTPLMGEMVRFVAALLFIHLLFGLLCWALAQLTRFALPAWGGRRWRVLFGWLAFSTLWLLAANAALFPWSETGIHGHWARATLLADVNVFDAITLLWIAAALFVVVGAAVSVPMLRRWLPRAAVYGVLLVGVIAAMRMIRGGETDMPEVGKPNIILIGIDSLRNDALSVNTGIGVTPNVDEFMRSGAHRFTSATTPLARTYPAWVSILSGKYPKHTGAREDLIGRDRLASFETLGDLARRAGYHTIWAMDEVRFSNIDESYGFDQRITPTIGVADFLLGKANDFPLSNVLADTRLAKWLFPSTYGNRAAAHVYQPDTFVEWLDDDTQPEKPTFLAVHLTLPHHPYGWAAPGDQIFSRDTDTTYRYLSAVIAADKQFGQLMAVLERKGMLRNALVVLLSDHGEGLGVPASDAMIRGREVFDLIGGHRIALHGHGSSVLSPNQYSVVLAMRGFGKAELPMPGREHPEPVSLVDIAPTVLDLGGIANTNTFDGSSLRPLIEGNAEQSARLANRVHFTETGFRTPLLDSGKIDEAGLMGQAAHFFRMVPATGRLEVRTELLPRLLADKERAAFNADTMLAAIPTSVEGTQHIYLLLDRHGGGGKRLGAAPSPETEPQAAELWRALHDYYGDELLPPLP